MGGTNPRSLEPESGHGRPVSLTLFSTNQKCEGREVRRLTKVTQLVELCQTSPGSRCPGSRVTALSELPPSRSDRFPTLWTHPCRCEPICLINRQKSLREKLMLPSEVDATPPSGGIPVGLSAEAPTSSPWKKNALGLSPALPAAPRFPP